MLGIADGDRGRPLDSDPHGRVHALRTTAYSRVPRPAGVPWKSSGGPPSRATRPCCSITGSSSRSSAASSRASTRTSRSASSSRSGPPSTGSPGPWGPSSITGPGSKPATLAVLQSLVRNQGTGWEHALHELQLYYEEVNRLAIPVAMVFDENESSFELSVQEVPHLVQRVVGGYLRSAATLGRRTAELHRALASDANDPDFAPEPLTSPDLTVLRGDIRTQFAKSLDVLKDTLDRLPEAIAPRARRVLDEAPGLAGSARPPARPETVLDQDPLPRRLPPGPGPADRRGLRHPRLRGRARQSPWTSGARSNRRSRTWSGCSARSTTRPSRRCSHSPRTGPTTSSGWTPGPGPGRPGPRPCSSAEYRAAVGEASFLPHDPDVAGGPAARVVHARQGPLRAALRAEQPAGLGPDPPGERPLDSIEEAQRVAPAPTAPPVADGAEPGGDHRVAVQ